jgi:hypothetical protein
MGRRRLVIRDLPIWQRLALGVGSKMPPQAAVVWKVP